MNIEVNPSLTYGYKSDIGRRREHNEDSVAVLNQTDLDGALDGLFIVADGMGGMGGGDVASSMVAKSLTTTIPRVLRTHRTGRLDVGDLLREAISQANRAVYTHRSQRSDLRNMGTTCVAAIVAGDELTLANVGDSRAYLLRDGKLLQLTEDHSHVWDEVRSGKMSREEAQHSRYRNVITRAVGLAPDIEPDIFAHRLQAGDTVLLCSDGLTVETGEAEIARILASVSDPQDACDRLVETALRHGGSDNVTVVVLRYGAFVPLDLPDDEEEDTDPDGAWRNAPDDEDAIFGDDRFDPGDLIPRHEARAAATKARAVIFLLLALAAAEAVGIGLLWRKAQRTPAAPAPAPKPALPPTAGPLDYPARPELIYKKPLRDDILLIRPDGSLLVATRQNRLLPITGDGAELRPLPMDRLDKPVPVVRQRGQRESNTMASAAQQDITLDASGNRYQIDPVAKSITKYDPGGVEIKDGIGLGRLTAPTRIAVAPSGDIYIIDNHQLKRFRALPGAVQSLSPPTASQGSSNGAP